MQQLRLSLASSALLLLRDAPCGEFWAAAFTAAMTSQVIAALRAGAEHDATIQRKEIAMRTALILVLAAFGAFTTYAMWQVGYLGIWQAGMGSVGAWQVLLDLVVMSCVVLGFIWRDARFTGRTVWPFALSSSVTRPGAV